MHETVLSTSQTRPVPSRGPDRVLDAAPPFLELLPIAIYACSADGRIRWFNRRAADLWGRAPRIGDEDELFCGSYRVLDLDDRPIRRNETPMAGVLKTGTPVRDQVVVLERPDGSRVLAALHIDPVFDSDGDLLGAINCFHDTTPLRRAPTYPEDGEHPARAVLEALPAAVYTTDAAGRITFYNRAAIDLWGCEPELNSSQWCGSWRLLWPDGRSMPHDECPMALALKESRAISGGEAIAERPDGTRIPFLAYPSPLRDASGALVGAVNMLVDITDRKRAEEQQKGLIDELNHRVKNTLATVQSLAAHTLRGAGVDRTVREAFDARLFALSRAHDQLTRERWESADLGSLLHDLFAPYRHGREDRVRLEGVPVKLAPQPALTLAMVLQELATNAAKYGALSAPQGALSVAWSVVANGAGPRLRLEWQESGGPAVTQPERRGFGTRLLERGIGSELKGSVEIDFAPDGVRCCMDIPV